MRAIWRWRNRAITVWSGTAPPPMKRPRASRQHNRSITRLERTPCEVTGIAAEGRFEVVTPERQERVAQHVDCWSTPEAGAEDDVQALTPQGDEGNDLLVGYRARKRAEDRNQQQMQHAIALALGRARVRHFGECGKQESK